jgi:hypothetical protein
VILPSKKGAMIWFGVASASEHCWSSGAAHIMFAMKESDEKENHD